MSFSVSTMLDMDKGFEWGSRNGISGLLAQKRNSLRLKPTATSIPHLHLLSHHYFNYPHSHLQCVTIPHLILQSLYAVTASFSLSPSFWRMILEIFKFKNHTVKYLEDHERNPDLDRNETLGQFITSHGYSKLFQDAYLIPMCACILPCPSPSQGVLGFPAFFVLSYCRDNHLLELFGRLQWHTVKGCSESYVNKARGDLESLGCQIKTSCEVKSVSSMEGVGYKVSEIDGLEDIYDQIIFGVNAPDALKILGAKATRDELRILGAFQYTNSDVYLHRDESFMPQSSSAWSAKNFLGTTSRGPCVTYWLNLIQNVEASRPFFVTLNPHRVPNHVLNKWHTSYPTPSIGSAKASLEFSHIQGKRGLWFCGSYQGYGFHEDGVKAGKGVAKRLLGKAKSSGDCIW